MPGLFQALIKLSYLNIFIVELICRYGRPNSLVQSGDRKKKVDIIKNPKDIKDIRTFGPLGAIRGQINGIIS